VVDLPGSGAFSGAAMARHVFGRWLLVSIAAIFGSPIPISVSEGHDVRATRESLRCAHCQLARRAMTLARCSMRAEGTAPMPFIPREPLNRAPYSLTKPNA